METAASRRTSCGTAASAVAVAASVVKAGGGGTGISSKSTPSPPNGDADALYVVGKILAEKTENGMSYFKVRWKNYPPSNDTWEPEHNLAVVADMIEAFRSARANKLGGSGNRASTGNISGSSGNSSGSRKRPAPKKWDQSQAPSSTAGAAAKTNKLLDGLDDDRPKSRRRLNGGSSGVGAGRESEDASAGDTTGEDGNSNNSEGGSSFANSVGSSSTLEIEGKSNAVSTAVAPGSSAVANATVIDAKAVQSSALTDGVESVNASANVDPANPEHVPPSSASSSAKPRHQSPLLADLLGSAKREPTSSSVAAASTVVVATDTSEDRSEKAASATASAASSAPTPSAAVLATVALPPDDADCRYVANQAELLRAHVAGQSARLPPNRPPPLSWPLLCRAVERGDWPAVSRTVSQHEPQLTMSDLQRLLCLAVARGHSCIVDLLLDAAAAVSVRTESPETLDIDCRSSDTGLTLLMLAVERDSPALVHRLLQAGADPNLLCPAGNSALQRAIKQRRPQLVDALCSLGGVDFGVETCEGQTPLCYARRACPQSAAVLQLYVGNLCRIMHDHLADHLARLGFQPAALLFAPRYLRPQPGLVCQVRFRLPEDEAARTGHAVALLHCRQRPCSALLRRQPCPDPISMYCWLSDGPCHADSVQLNGVVQRPLTACGAPFLTALNSPKVGENCLRVSFPSRSISCDVEEILRAAPSNVGDVGLRIGVFAFRMSALPPAPQPD